MEFFIWTKFIFFQIVRHLIGHGSSINELHFHPIQRRLLASASKDHTIRIWDVWSEVIVFILGGLHGHRDEVNLFQLLLVTINIFVQVLSCDFQPTGNQIASCGMDHSILIWDISSERAKLGMFYFIIRMYLVILFSNKSRISFQVEQFGYAISDSNASPNFLNTWYSFQLHRLY